MLKLITRTEINLAYFFLVFSLKERKKINHFCLHCSHFYTDQTFEMRFTLRFLNVISRFEDSTDEEQIEQSAYVLRNSGFAVKGKQQRTGARVKGWMSDRPSTA